MPIRYFALQTEVWSPAERINLGLTYEQDGKSDLALREYERAERKEC